MTSNEKESFVSTLSDTVIDIKEKIVVDPSSEIAEPNILLQENLPARKTENKPNFIRENTKINTQSVPQRRTVTFDDKNHKIKRSINPNPISNDEQKKQSLENLVTDPSDTNIDTRNLEDIVKQFEKTIS